MSSGKQSFKETELARAIRAADRARMKIERIELEKGKIVIFPDSGSQPVSDLDRELKEFEARNNGQA